MVIIKTKKLSANNAKDAKKAKKHYLV